MLVVMVIGFFWNLMSILSRLLFKFGLDIKILFKDSL